MTYPKHYVPHEQESPDAWHAHGAGEGEPQPEHGGHQNYLLIGLVGVASLAIVVGTVAGTFIYFRKHVTDLRREKVESPTMLRGDYDAYKKDADAKLAQFRFMGEDAARAGRATLPLDEAKKRVIEKYQKSRKAEGGATTERRS